MAGQGRGMDGAPPSGGDSAGADHTRFSPSSHTRSMAAKRSSTRRAPSPSSAVGSTGWASLRTPTPAGAPPPLRGPSRRGRRRWRRRGPVPPAHRQADLERAVRRLGQRRVLVAGKAGESCCLAGGRSAARPARSPPRSPRAVVGHVRWTRWSSRRARPGASWPRRCRPMGAKGRCRPVTRRRAMSG